MRTWSTLVFALSLLAVGPALAHHDAETDGIVAEDSHGEAKASDHGDAHGEAKAHKAVSPASAGQVGMTATVVLVLVGSGIGLVGVLREQLG